MKLLTGLAVALLLSGCRVETAPEEDVTAPIPGVHQAVGPSVALGMVPTASGTSVALTASANAAGGLCLDEDDGMAPLCLPASSVAETGDAEIASAWWEDGRGCVYALAPLSVTSLTLVDADSDEDLVVLDLLEGSEALGEHLFVGCYDDELPLARQALRTEER